MRLDWQDVTIADACDVVNGGTPRTGVAANWGGSHMWITPAEMGGRTDPYVGETHRQLTDAGLAAANLLPPYSVILSSRAPIGHLVINTVPMATNQGCKGLVPKPGLDHKYLFYYLGSVVGLLNDLGTGTTFKEISGGRLKKVPIPIPPLPEQQRIVASLDEVFAGLAIATANAEKNLKNAGELFDSHLNAEFDQPGEGWITRRLGDFSRIGYGYTQSASQEEIGPKFLRITDIQNNSVDWEAVPYCAASVEGLQKFRLESGDIVFARTGATTGKSYMVTDPPEAVFASYLIRVQPAPEVVSSPFLNLFFQSRSYWDQIRLGISGSAQGGFNATKLASLTVALPQSLTAQDAIVSKLTELSTQTTALAAIYRSKLDKLRDLKQSILQKAFSGELTSPPSRAIKEAAE